MVGSFAALHVHVRSALQIPCTAALTRSALHEGLKPTVHGTRPEAPAFPAVLDALAPPVCAWVKVLLLVAPAPPLPAALLDWFEEFELPPAWLELDAPPLWLEFDAPPV